MVLFQGEEKSVVGAFGDLVLLIFINEISLCAVPFPGQNFQRVLSYTG